MRDFLKKKSGLLNPAFREGHHYSDNNSMLKATIQIKYITIPIIGSSPVDKSVLTEPILVFVRHLQIKQ